MAMVTIAEASQRMGVSVHTLKRRLKRGELQGEQRPTPQGYVWTVAIPDGIPPSNGATPSGTPTAIPDDVPAPGGDNGTLREMVEILQSQITGLQDQLRTMNQALSSRDNQITELVTVVRQTQAMLPAPKPQPRRRWQFLRA